MAYCTSGLSSSEVGQALGRIESFAVGSEEIKSVSNLRTGVTEWMSEKRETDEGKG